MSRMTEYACFESFPFPQKFVVFVCQTMWFLWNVKHWTSGVNVHNEKSNRYAALKVPQLKEFLAFSVKDRYQFNYFICIKDFNAQTITSLKLNLFSSFIYCCQHHERKTICLDIFLLSDRQWDAEHQYLLSRFLGISILTITYNLLHLQLWYVDVVTVIA
jgi:hypothetical protein